MKSLKNIVKGITNILLVLYPIFIFFAFYYNQLKIAIFCLILLFLLRILTASSSLLLHMKWLVKIISFCGLFLAICSWILAKSELLLYYPVIVNIALLTLFSYSLKKPPTIIERFARMQEPNLPEKAVHYTQKVTIFWCFFFVINGGIALITCLLADLKWWTIYNGGISYILIAILMGAEWLLRRKYQN